MIKFFTFSSWFRKGDNRADSNSPMVWESKPIGAISSTSKFSNANGINFTVYAANGGHIVEFRQYDPRTDRSTTHLHIVPDGEEFANEIAKIVTLECLRNPHS